MKENELKARQNDIAIQAQSNKVQMKKKDLEVEMSVKDNEVAMQKKLLENSIRMKEMDIEISEEHKRRSLLEVKKENDLVEAEFEGRAKGHEFREFMLGIDPNLTAKQKIDLYIKKCDLEQAKLLYAKVPGVTLYPTDADLKVFEMPHNSEGQAAQLQGGSCKPWVQCSRSRNHRCLALSYSSLTFCYEFIQANYSTHYSLPTLSLDTLARPLEALERSRVGSSLF